MSERDLEKHFDAMDEYMDSHVPPEWIYHPSVGMIDMKKAVAEDGEDRRRFRVLFPKKKADTK